MDNSADDTTIDVALDGTTLRVAIVGRLALQHFLESVSQAAMLQAKESTSGMLVDFTGVDDVDLSDEDIFRAVTALRRRLLLADSYRCGVVVPPELLGLLGEEFIRVRDLLTGGAMSGPDVRPFLDLEEATAWVKQGPSAE